MATYRFIGLDSQVTLDGKLVELNQYGQALELTDEQAAVFEKDNLPIVPDDEFKKVFSDAEIKAGDFRPDKRFTAMQKFVERIIALHARKQAPAPAPAAPAEKPDAPAEKPATPAEKPAAPKATEQVPAQSAQTEEKKDKD